MISFAAHWRGGDVVLNDELDEYRWVDPKALGELIRSRTVKTTQGLPDIIESARKLIGT